MDNDNLEAKRYLTELCTKTQGDIGAQVSMYNVGAAIGLEKTEAGMVAEALIVEGLAELRSLSGGIGITAQGVAMIQGAGGGPVCKSGGFQLGSGALRTRYHPSRCFDLAGFVDEASMPMGIRIHKTRFSLWRCTTWQASFRYATRSSLSKRTKSST